jgi:acyl-CoA thioesterase-1
MIRFLLFFAGGEGFLIGWSLLAAALLVSCLRRRWWVALIRVFLVLLAAAAIFLSATPLPAGLYWIWILTVLTWLIGEHLPPLRESFRKRARLIAALVCLAAGLAELPYAVVPGVSGHYSRLYVIGDSITAGLGRPGVTTWPSLLRQREHVEIVDLSRAGATVDMIVRQMPEVRFAEGLVLLEIGGNDLIGRGTAPGQFESALDALLRRVSGPGRMVVMLELPLFPGEFGLGRIQRRLARKHGAVLIPRRCLAGILRAEGATTDGIHLSARGHEQMAERLWTILGPAMR